MRIGVVLMPTDPWSESVAIAQRLESLGYHHLWVYDHLTWRRFRDQPWHATYPWLTGMAAVTQRIRLGTMVSNPNIRHPVTLAKDAMTIDHISGGRLTLGIGAGGIGYDATALGQDPLTPAQRIDRLEEFLPILDGLLRGRLTDHAGPWYAVNEARMLPGCRQQPRLPLAVAAGRRRGIGLAARCGDAWITNGDPSLPELTPEKHQAVLSDQVAMLAEACQVLGRDPSTIDRILMTGNAEDRPLRSIEAFTDYVGRYSELGFTDLAFHHPRPDDPILNDPVEIVEEIAERFLD